MRISGTLNRLNHYFPPLRGPALRALLFALFWFFAPAWIFFLAAVALYFLPLQHVGKVTVPFFVLVLLSMMEPHGIILAVILGGLFFYILLIRDFLLIDRKSAYEILIFFLTFLALRLFYIDMHPGIHLASILSAFLIAIVFSLLIDGFTSSFDEQASSSGSTIDAGSHSSRRRLRRVAAWLSFFIMWQVLIATLFLPLGGVAQSTIAFLIAIFLVDLVPFSLWEELSRARILGTSTVVFALLVIVLGAQGWRL